MLPTRLAIAREVIPTPSILVLKTPLSLISSSSSMTSILGKIIEAIFKAYFYSIVLLVSSIV
jgi:ABC-type dipeptide/oligopeptide/nickel transport system ATPase subunit